MIIYEQIKRYSHRELANELAKEFRYSLERLRMGYSVNEAMETLCTEFGHMLKLHFNLSMNEAIKTMTEKTKESIGVFDFGMSTEESYRHIHKLVLMELLQQVDKVTAWLQSGPYDKYEGRDHYYGMSLNSDTAYVCGKTYTRTGKIYESKNITFVLKRDKLAPCGFILVTAYPKDHKAIGRFIPSKIALEPDIKFESPEDRLMVYLQSLSGLRVVNRYGTKIIITRLDKTKDGLDRETQLRIERYRDVHIRQTYQGNATKKISWEELNRQNPKLYNIFLKIFNIGKQCYEFLPEKQKHDAPVFRF